MRLVTYEFRQVEHASERQCGQQIVCGQTVFSDNNVGLPHEKFE